MVLKLRLIGLKRNMGNRTIYSSCGKRLLDIFVSFSLLLLTSPILLIVSIVLAFINNGKILFLQKRPGWREQPFYIIKFKTMRDAFDSNGNALPDKDRITKIGSLVRKLSIDELLQLINVIKGEMSLIGPRPLLMKYLPLYSDFQKRRHEVRPGITGWAQVNGRNTLSWQDKFRYDVEYVDNISFGLDIKIFWLTIVKVFKSEGINQSEERPMTPFEGEG